MIDWYICFDPKTVSFKPFRFVTKMYVGVYLHEFVSRDGERGRESGSRNV